MGQGNPATSSASVSDKVTPEAQNATATQPGTRYGKGGSFPGEGDNSTETIVTSASPGV